MTFPALVFMLHSMSLSSGNMLHALCVEAFWADANRSFVASLGAVRHDGAWRITPTLVLSSGPSQRTAAQATRRDDPHRLSLPWNVPPLKRNMSASDGGHMLLFLRCDHGRQLCEHQHNGRVRTHVMRRISCHNYSGHCPRGQLCHEQFIIYMQW